jgi:capsule biosynthesis phosphatase
MKLNYDFTKYYKTIVCDLDDTICYTTTHDWENAEPIWGVINKLNEFANKGWQIIILTARGQVSCEGDVEKADLKYREIIEKWLTKHGVKYHILSFHKYLGTMYLDDKGLDPNEFVNLDIKDIKTGWSGAIVEKRGNRIYKTHPDSLQVANWYKMASPLVNCPIVYNVIGETICLEFLNVNGKNFKIDDVNKDIEKFSLYKTYIPFSTYIDRMKKHCDWHHDFYEILDLLKKEEEIFNLNNSFCHGDFSIENILQTNEGMFLIDPIYNPNNWSSYLLDVTKMMHSYRKYNRMFEYSVFMNYWIEKGIKGISYRLENADKNKKYVQYILQLLECSQFIRVIKYIPDPTLKKEYYTLTKTLLKQLIKNKELTN